MATQMNNIVRFVFFFIFVVFLLIFYSTFCPCCLLRWQTDQLGGVSGSTY